jgi:cell division GTPase FtsZ
MNAVGEFIASKVDGLATIFFGMVGDEELEDRVKITVIATGIPVNAEKPEKKG